MMHRSVFPTFLVLLFGCSTLFAQTISDRPISLELGGSPGGGVWFTGGNGNTESNFNVYTIAFYADWYANQRVAVEGEYTFGFGMSQDLTFRNGLIPGQQVPWTNDIAGRVLYFPQTTTARLPFYVGAGLGRLTLVSRRQTKNLGYDPDVTSSGSFLAPNIGGGVKLRPKAMSPNWSFRLDYRLLFVKSNNDAPAFFAQSKSRVGSQVAFSMQYAFRR